MVHTLLNKEVWQYGAHKAWSDLIGKLDVDSKKQRHMEVASIFQSYEAVTRMWYRRIEIRYEDKLKSPNPLIQKLFGGQYMKRGKRDMKITLLKNITQNG